MKSYIFFIGLCLMFNVVSAQWILQNSGTTALLHSVFFTNVDTGYVVGSNGILLKTMDGGISWTQQNAGINEDLYCVYFPSRDTGYVVGDSSILRTTNGGLTWQSNLTGYHSHHSVFFTSNDTGYIAGVYRVVKTTDGGVSWNEILYNDAETYTSISFPAKDRGTVVGQYWHPKVHYIICNTENSGFDWSCQGSYSQETEYYSFVSVQFPTTDVGYAVGSILFKSYNGGSWDIVSHESGNSVYFTTPEFGYIVGNNGKILYSTDGGTNWANQFSGIAVDLTSTYFVNEDVGYVVGDSGTILKTNNGGFPVGIQPKGDKADNGLIYLSNPSTSTFSFELEGEKIISIYDINGRCMTKFASKEDNVTIDLNYFEEGVYILRIVQDRSVYVEKLIKK